MRHSDPACLPACLVHHAGVWCAHAAGGCSAPASRNQAGCFFCVDRGEARGRCGGSNGQDAGQNSNGTKRKGSNKGVARRSSEEAPEEYGEQSNKENKTVSKMTSALHSLAWYAECRCWSFMRHRWFLSNPDRAAGRNYWKGILGEEKVKECLREIRPGRRGRAGGASCSCRPSKATTRAQAQSQGIGPAAWCRA